LACLQHMRTVLRPPAGTDSSFGLPLVPLDRVPEPYFHWRARLPAELFQGAGCVKAATRLAIGPRGVPFNRPLIAHESLEQLGKIANGAFFLGAAVDELGCAVFPRSHDNSFGRIFDIQEFARGLPRAPGADGWRIC